jgi:hypothetical protein
MASARRHWILAVELTPFAGVAVLLTTSVTAGVMTMNEYTGWAAVLELVAPVVALAVGWRRSLWRVPCLLAPLALIYPLAVVPTHFGIGFVDFPGFLAYVTEHPNVGPVNRDVFLGFLCLLGASTMPVVHAMIVRASSNRWLLTALFLAGLVPYVAVLLYLDRELVLFARYFQFPPFAFGIVLRTLGVVGMASGTVLAWTRDGASPDL